MNIEQIRDELANANRELNAARDAGIKMSRDNTSSAEELTRVMNNVERLRAQASLLSEQLSEAESAQSAQARAQIMNNEDMIMRGAERFNGMGDFFHAVARNRRDADPRLAEYASIRSAASGQNLTTDADGGVLVPPDYAAELLNFAQSDSVLYPLVQHTPVSGNSLVENYVVSNTRGDTAGANIGRGGVVAYWKGEAEQYASSKIKFGQFQTQLNKLTGMAYATDEMLEDYPALASIIAEGFRNEFAYKIDEAILCGTGAANGQPIGVLDNANTALVTINKEASQPAASIVLSNILKMYNAMPAKNRANAKFFVNQDVELALMTMLMQVGEVASTGASAVEDLIGSMGKPVYLPGGTIANAPNGLLLGREVVPVEQCSALGTAGDINFIDFSQYRWIEKGGIKATTSVHVRFDYDEQAFKFTYRCGGRPIWQNSITAANGATTRSPFVTLQTRA